jgi:hypothetical protein
MAQLLSNYWIIEADQSFNRLLKVRKSPKIDDFHPNIEYLTNILPSQQLPPLGSATESDSGG